LVRQIPPDQIIEFMRAGLSPPQTFDEVRESIRTTGNWYGSDDLWISLPANGVVTWGSSTWPSKFWTYALVPGRASGEARRLDGPTPPGAVATFNGGVGGEGPGFIASAYLFATNGCWEGTYRVGDATLRFVVKVQRS
jgi:hypothetical protein